MTPEAPRGVGALLWTVLERWIDHGAPTRSAAIAFYSLTSMAPLSVLLVWIGATALESGSVRAQLVRQLTAAVGPDATALVQSVVSAASIPRGGALIPTLIGVVIFLFSATAVFGQLQGALRDVWGAPEGPPGAGRQVVGFLRRRLIAVLLVGALGMVLAASMAARVVMSALASSLPASVPGSLVDVAVSGVTLVALFVLVFKILPDAEVSWTEAGLGGIVTGILHVAGQWAVGAYLGREGIGSAYGAAASLVVFLSWVYYSSLVFLLGAEVTRAVSSTADTPV